jgi:hypothetical protein
MTKLTAGTDNRCRNGSTGSEDHKTYNGKLAYVFMHHNRFVWRFRTTPRSLGRITTTTSKKYR